MEAGILVGKYSRGLSSNVKRRCSLDIVRLSKEGEKGEDRVLLAGERVEGKA